MYIYISAYEQKRRKEKEKQEEDGKREWRVLRYPKKYPIID
jgi:hypothetical protein